MAYIRFGKDSDWHIFYDGSMSSHSPKVKNSQVVTVMVSSRLSGKVDGDDFNIELSFTYAEIKKKGVEFVIENVMDAVGCGVSYKEMCSGGFGMKIWDKWGLDFKEECEKIEWCVRGFIEDVEEEFCSSKFGLDVRKKRKSKRK